MRFLDNRFSSRNGFSSSQWNHMKKINDANMMDSSCQNSLTPSDLISSQNKSKSHQKLECGLLT